MPNLTELVFSTPDVSTLLIALVGSGGVLGALVALLKLRPERNSAAVAQAQGANETLVELNQTLERALDRANKRADRYLDELEEAQQRLDRKDTP